MLSCVSGTRDTEMKRKCACPQLDLSLGREWDILMNKCNVISSIIPETDKAWKKEWAVLYGVKENLLKENGT